MDNFNNFSIFSSKPHPTLSILEPKTITLATTRSCKLDPEDTILKHLDIHFHSATNQLDVVDLQSTWVEGD